MACFVSLIERQLCMGTLFLLKEHYHQILNKTQSGKLILSYVNLWRINA